MPAKLSEEKIIKIRKEVISGKTKKQVAYEYDLGYSTVKRITRDINNLTKLTDEEINLLREEVQSGKTKKQVSRETDISYYIVKKFTEDICYYNSLPFVLQKQIQDEYERGVSKQKIAEKLNVSYDTVKKYTIQGHDDYRTYREVPTSVIKKIRKQVSQGIPKMQVSRNLNISYAKVKRFTRDLTVLNRKNKRFLLSKSKIQKIRNEIKNGKTKIQVAREMNLPPQIVYYHTTDLITGHVHDSKLSGKTYELLQEIMKNGYALPSKKYTLKNYQKLYLKFPNIQRVKMYGRVIYFLEERAELAVKAFLKSLPERITNYYELKQVIDVFKTHMKKEEKKQYIKR